MGKTIYLVDAMSYIFRAYYGVGGALSNKDGFPTTAIFGFKNMVRRLLEQKEVQYLVMVFDSDSKSFRSEMYPEYKANRSAAPEDLKLQFNPIFELVNILNIPSIKKESWEADDIIAELARKFSNEVDEVMIVSGDKDLTQLINDKVSMYDGMRGVKYTKTQVKKKYGVYPEQIAEYLALVGDSSDNIPGAKGIGPKTAEILFNEYQNLENIYQHLDKIKPTLRKKLEENKKNVDISFKLTNLEHVLGLECKLEDFFLQKPQEEALRKFYYTYGFAEDSLLANCHSSALVEKRIKRDYRLINTKKELKKYFEQIEKEKIFAFDLETTSLSMKDAKIVGIALAVSSLPAAYIPLNHQENTLQLEIKAVLQDFQRIFQNPEIKLVAHNLKYEMSVLGSYAIKPKNQLEDTMLQSYLLYSDAYNHGLDKLADIFLDHQCITFAQVAGSGKDALRFDQVPIEKAYIYAAEDADVTLQLFQKFSPMIQQKNLQELYQKVEIPLCLLLAEMEMRGVKIDSELFCKLSSKIKAQSQQIAKEIYCEAKQEFNINSPKQLGEILFEKMGIQKFKKKTKTGYSTDATVLEKLATKYPIANKIHIYRSKQKLVNTYLEVLPSLVDPKTGRIHTSYHQTIAATGRLSSKNPNLQNIPIRGEDGALIREGFIAEKHHCLISADYSQIELRLLAHFCGDEKLVQAFREQKDIHSQTAANIFQVEQQQVDKEMRAIAKAINFGIIYGMGATKLSQEIGISRKEASEFITTYFAQYPKIQVFISEAIASARRKEFVTTLLGRMRNVKAINDKNAMLRSAMERIAVNTKIQGSAADIIKLAMIKIVAENQKLGEQHQMIMQIHDELVFEVPLVNADTVMQQIKKQMENAYSLLIPLQVDIQKGKNWRQIH